MRLRHALVFLLLAVPARGGEPFAGLQRGDEVEVVLEAGPGLRGVVRSVLDGRLRLELTGDDGRLTGSVTLEGTQVHAVRKTGVADLDALDAEARRRAAERPPPPVEAADPGPPPQVAPPEDAGEALLRRFPPSDWSDARREAILARDPWLRTEEESVFLDVWETWHAALGRREREARADLVRRYPPEAGWGRERRETLAHTTAVIGRSLTAAEREFVDRFEDWERGVAEGARPAPEGTADSR